MSMFCYQCEQALQGKGCTVAGVCGKNETTATLQDDLLNRTKHISQYAYRASQLGSSSAEINRFIIQALFTTVTNVNFDPDRLNEIISKSDDVLSAAQKLYSDACASKGQDVESIPELLPIESPEIQTRTEKLGEDVAGLQELIVYGLKGTAAYADHALILGQSDDTLSNFFAECLNFLTTEEAKSLDHLVPMALKVGEINLKAMELLDAGNTGTYGHPEPTSVRTTAIKGKAILVSGHDLYDLYALLEQTEGQDINVYTHGEMLPCNSYPGLKKFKHLAGNYGGAWQDQRAEFEKFPGAILMTTNCIQKPKATYNDRIFTSGLVAWPGVKHISDGDYTPVIQAALNADGFSETEEEKSITIGFGRNTVMSVADKVIEGVKGGDIKHFFLVGGCDGAKPGRNYYTELAEQIPEDCVILTLACGKFRFNKLDFGDIGGIPRLLDIGQCNDAYSAIQIAVALAGAFDCGVNDLPLSLVLSWYEQKAVCILLSLLHLGIKNIKIGPTLPAFISPAVLNVLVENFALAPVTTPEQDLAEMLG